MFGSSNHGKRHAVFDGAAGVLALKLDEKATRTDVETADFEQRRVADQFKHTGRTGRHGHDVFFIVTYKR